MTIDDIRPLPQITDDGEVIPTVARRLALRDNGFMDKPYKKLKYILMKYVFENINNEEMVPSRYLNVEVFAMALYDLHEELGKNQY
jgi:hypothetical protein